MYTIQSMYFKQGGVGGGEGLLVNHLESIEEYSIKISLNIFAINSDMPRLF